MLKVLFKLVSRATFVFLISLMVVSLSAQDTNTTSSTSSPILSGEAVLVETNGAPTVAVIETGAPVSGSVGRALNDLGIAFTLFRGDNFSALDLSSFSTVVVAMDGGVVMDPSVANIQNYANNGGNLVMLGGTCIQQFADAVNSRLLKIDTQNSCWSTVRGIPHLTVTDPDHPLAAGLPDTYNFANINATFYMIRANDPDASEAAVNGDSFVALLNKALGDGSLSWFINSASDSYWGNPNDLAILETVLANTVY